MPRDPEGLSKAMGKKLLAAEDCVWLSDEQPFDTLRIPSPLFARPRVNSWAGQSATRRALPIRSLSSSSSCPTCTCKLVVWRRSDTSDFVDLHVFAT